MRTWLALLCGVIAGCSTSARVELVDGGPDGGESGIDAGRDAGGVAGPDAGTDGGAAGIDAGLDAGPDAGADGGDCLVADVAASLVTDAGVDCGSFDVPIFPQSPEAMGWDAGPLEAGVACAFASQAAGIPFMLQLTSVGVDTSYTTAYVRAPDGRSLTLDQSGPFCPVPYDPDRGLLDQTPCNAFVPATWDDPVDDGGMPGIECGNAGASIALCSPCP
jgi:hypothetical protein